MINADGIQVNITAKMAITPQASCVGTIPDPATCSLVGGTWTTLCSTLMSTIQSKLGCEAVAGTWNYGTSSNLCLKMSQNGKNYETEVVLPTIIENGQSQIITFPVMFNDANNDDVKDAGESGRLVFGEVTMGVYEDCTFATAYNSRPDVTVTLFPNTTLPTINW